MSTDPPTASGTLSIRAELLRGNRRVVAAAFLLGVIAAIATVALPLVVRELITAIQEDDGVLLPILLLAGLALGGGLATALSTFLLARVGERMVLDLRTRMIGRILRLPLNVVRREGTGTLVSRVGSDAAQLRSVVDVGVTEIPVSAVSIVLGLVVMGFLDWVLLLIALGSFAVSATAIGVVVRGIRRNALEQQTAIGILAQRLAAGIAALPIVRAQRAEEHVASEISASAGQASRSAVAAARLQSLVSPVMELGLQVALIGVVVGSGARLANGALTVPDFAAFLLYLLQLVSPLTVVALGVSRLQTGLSARERIAHVLDLEPEVDDGRLPATVDTPEGAPAIAFEDVVFAYDERPVLDGVSFAAPAHGMTAIVGPSGAGKSTILQLVERFVNVGSGTVRVHGHPVEEWRLDGLRRRVEYVDQAFTLLEGSIRENLTLGRDTPATDEQLLAALERVGLREDVLGMEGGLDGRIGRGVDISGGQRQRLACARALLTEADIVLFDEPTAQLDSVNDDLLRIAIEQLSTDRAVVVVAHRIATIRAADRIVVVEAGRVVGTGTHDELVDGCPTYAGLVTLQRLGDPTTTAKETAR